MDAIETEIYENETMCPQCYRGWGGTYCTNEDCQNYDNYDPADEKTSPDFYADVEFLTPPGMVIETVAEILYKRLSSLTPIQLNALFGVEKLDTLVYGIGVEMCSNNQLVYWCRAGVNANILYETGDGLREAGINMLTLIEKKIKDL